MNKIYYTKMRYFIELCHNTHPNDTRHNGIQQKFPQHNR
jgi:hypothetical protein